MTSDGHDPLDMPDGMRGADPPPVPVSNEVKGMVSLSLLMALWQWWKNRR